MKEGDEVVGNETRVKVVKNKVAPPFGKLNFRFCTEEVFTERVRFWSSEYSKVSSRRQGRGTPIKVTV